MGERAVIGVINRDGLCERGRQTERERDREIKREREKKVCVC